MSQPVTVQMIRELELQLIRPYLPPAGRILEIGAGQGWQARRLADLGYAVQAVDVPGSAQAQQAQFPLCFYNGIDLPFADAAFDVVFSSSVMEHVTAFGPLQREIRRVLKPGGLAIHIVPNAVWRIWTSIVHYPDCLRTPRRLLYRPWPARHGENGNAWSEVLLFRNRHWCHKFADCGWVVRECFSNRLFYTGQLLLAGRIGLLARRRLAAVLGGVCTVYVLSAAPGPEARPG